MADDRVLRALLRFGIDRPSASETRAGLDSIKRGLTDVEKQAERTRQQFQQIKAAGRELSQIGLQIGAVGLAIGGPLVAAAKAFVDANQKTSVIARQWQRDTDSLTASYQRIGGVVAREMLPALDKATELTDKLADFAEKHPEIIKAALGTAGALVAGGSALAVTGQILQTAANLGLLVTALKGGGTAAGGAAAGGSTAAGAGLLGVGATVGGSLIVAQIINSATEAAAKSFFAEFEKRTGTAADTSGLYGFVKNNLTNYGPAGLGQIGALISAIHDLVNKPAAPVYGPPAPPDYYANQAYYNAADRSRRQTEGLAGPSEFATAFQKALPVFQAYQTQKNDALLSYIDNRAKILDDFQKTYWDNEANYAQTRSREVRDFETEEKQAQESYNTTRVRQLRDFAQSETRDEQSYYEGRLKQARDYNIETARAEQDHQDELLKLQSDHADRARDLAAAGDALGFVKEQRDYEKQRAESEKQYQKDTARRDADYALQLKDGEDAFKEQREQRLADFEQQQRDQADDFKEQQDQAAAQQRQRLADMDHDFKESQAKLQTQRDQALDDLDANYAKETQHITDAFTDALNAIDPILTGMKDAVKENFDEAQTEFAHYLEGFKNIAGGGAGYCQPGYHWDNQTKTCMKNSHPGTETSAGGGYAFQGAVAGQGEFILSRSATSFAEKLLGGPLSQAEILSRLAGNNSYTVNLGGISASWGDRQGALGQVLGLVDERITSAFDQFTSLVEGRG